MATKKKAKRRTRSKKAPVSKPATRSKTTVVRKRPVKKAPVRRASPKKAGPPASSAAKPTLARPPAQAVAATRTPSPPPQPAPREERIGVVTHLLQPPLSRDAAARARYGAARWRHDPHPRTHHRFQPEGRVPRS